MDPVRNPFAPGAGSQPPELAGRAEIVAAADTALRRILVGRAAQSQMLLGLRGVGKTVLLNRIEQLAEERGYTTSFVEAPEDRKLVGLLYPKIQQTLRKLSLVEEAKAASYAAMRALRGFAKAFKIDEVQYLSTQELGALIVAMHRVNQKGLPVLFFGAGLPAIAGLSGDAKADSGNLEYDLTELFLKVGAATKAAGRGWALFKNGYSYSLRWMRCRKTMPRMRYDIQSKRKASLSMEIFLLR